MAGWKELLQKAFINYLTPNEQDVTELGNKIASEYVPGTKTRTSEMANEMLIAEGKRPSVAAQIPRNLLQMAGGMATLNPVQGALEKLGGPSTEQTLKTLGLEAPEARTMGEGIIQTWTRALPDLLGLAAMAGPEALTTLAKEGVSRELHFPKRPSAEKALQELETAMAGRKGGPGADLAALVEEPGTVRPPYKPDVSPIGTQLRPSETLAAQAAPGEVSSEDLNWLESQLRAVEKSGAGAAQERTLDMTKQTMQRMYERFAQGESPIAEFFRRVLKHPFEVRTYAGLHPAGGTHAGGSYSYNIPSKLELSSASKDLERITGHEISHEMKTALEKFAPHVQDSIEHELRAQKWVRHMKGLQTVLDEAQSLPEKLQPEDLSRLAERFYLRTGAKSSYFRIVYPSLKESVPETLNVHGNIRLKSTLLESLQKKIMEAKTHAFRWVREMEASHAMAQEEKLKMVQQMHDPDPAFAWDAKIRLGAHQFGEAIRDSMRSELYRVPGQESAMREGVLRAEAFGPQLRELASVPHGPDEARADFLERMLNRLYEMGGGAQKALKVHPDLQEWLQENLLTAHPR